MATPLTDDERNTIAVLLEEGHSRAEIARRTGRSHWAIAKIAAEIGHRTDQSVAARTRAANEARSAFCAERRAASAARAQERLDEILDGFFDQQPVVGSSMSGPKVVMVKPDARALADRAKAVQTLQRMVLDIDRHDRADDEATSAVAEWLRAMTGSGS